MAACARRGLHAIKSDIIANLSQPGLAVAAVALRHGISPRYIRALFASEQTSFTDFVREQRLRFAYRLLSSTEAAGRSISAIAFESGFGDLSYFNHSFRRRFAQRPPTFAINRKMRRPARSIPQCGKRVEAKAEAAVERVSFLDGRVSRP